jgi:hypothetical protein
LTQEDDLPVIDQCVAAEFGGSRRNDWKTGQMPDDDQDFQSSSAATWRFKKYCIMVDFEDDKKQGHLFSFSKAVPLTLRSSSWSRSSTGKKAVVQTCVTGCLVFVPRQWKLNRRSIEPYDGNGMRRARLYP